MSEIKRKYVLVSIIYTGDEPMMYAPDTGDLDDLPEIISVEESLTKKLQEASWNDGVTWLDVAFIQDGKEFPNRWRKFTWLHTLDVIKYVAWRVFLVTRTVLNKLGS